MSQLPAAVLESGLAFLFAHFDDWLFRLVAPFVKLTHVIKGVTVNLFHSSLECGIGFPPFFAALPPFGLFFSFNGDLHTFLHTAVEDVHAFCLFQFIAIVFVYTAAVDIGFPQ